jgi:hypothetical protein
VPLVLRLLPGTDSLAKARFGADGMCWSWARGDGEGEGESWLFIEGSEVDLTMASGG